MKITIEFNLPEDQEIYDNFRDAQSMRHALHEFNRYIRANTKYAPDFFSEDTLKAYTNVKKEFDMLTEGLINE